MSQVESLPTTWTAEDERFFFVVSQVFSTAFLFGASVLLASYDDVVDVEQPATAAAPAAARSTAAPVGSVRQR